MNDNDELCPKCGRWTSLNERTGWCESCTYSDREPQFINRVRELQEEQGLTKHQARSKYHEERRPNCVICGEPIRYARITAKFCSRNKKCVKARGRYQYYVHELKMDKTAAVEKTIGDFSVNRSHSTS